MMPAIKHGDRILAIRSAGKFRRGNVVFFEDDTHNMLRLKRVIGLPGETISIIRGKVLINGRELARHAFDPGYISDFGPMQIPMNSYFILGDNWAKSFDSRNFGSVPRDKLLYKALLIYKPFRRFKFLI